VNVGTFDRKTAILLVGGVSAVLLLKFVVMRDSTPAPVEVNESAPVALKRLAKVREIAATVPAKQELLKQATAELESREKGLLKADTGDQAKAILQDKLHRLGEQNGIDIRGMEDARVRPLGADYGEAMVFVRFNCRIEQLVNLLAALANEPELLATNQIQVTGTPDKNKNLVVRLGLSGVVTKKVAQEKKVGTGL
jgi:Type II secretion system (T2SS), protein M subtype b